MRRHAARRPRRPRAGRPTRATGHAPRRPPWSRPPAATDGRWAATDSGSRCAPRRRSVPAHRPRRRRGATSGNAQPRTLQASGGQSARRRSCASLTRRGSFSHPHASRSSKRRNGHETLSDRLRVVRDLRGMAPVDSASAIRPVIAAGAPGVTFSCGRGSVNCCSMHAQPSRGSSGGPNEPQLVSGRLTDDAWRPMRTCLGSAC